MLGKRDGHATDGCASNFRVYKIYKRTQLFTIHCIVKVEIVSQHSVMFKDC